jgi:hypothetical protein
MVGESALSSGEGASPDGKIARVVEPVDERLDGGVASAQDHRPGEPDGDEELVGAFFRFGRHRATNPTVKAWAPQHPSRGNERARPSSPSLAW